MKQLLIAVCVLVAAATAYAQSVQDGSRWAIDTGQFYIGGLAHTGKIFATFTADYTRVTFAADAAEMQVCMPSGQCRSVFEIAAWMEQPK